jgi:hypothetical protein
VLDGGVTMQGDIAARGSVGALGSVGARGGVAAWGGVGALYGIDVRGDVDILCQCPSGISTTSSSSFDKPDMTLHYIWLFSSSSIFKRPLCLGGSGCLLLGRSLFCGVVLGHLPHHVALGVFHTLFAAIT